MQLKHALSTTFGLLMFSAAVIATAADMPVIKPLRVTVESVSNNTLTFTVRSGAQHTTGLTEQTGSNRVPMANIEPIEFYNFIGTAAITQANRKLKSLEGTVFAAGLKSIGDSKYAVHNT